MTDWRELAACREWPTPDDFFPVTGDVPKDIRNLCAGCEVRFTCLDWAIKHERYGIWAATNESTRDALRNRAGIALEVVSPWHDRRPPEYAPCGTVAAAKRHQRNGESMCDACRMANRAYDQKKRDMKRRREMA